MSQCTPASQEEKKDNGTTRTVLTELAWGANQMQVIRMRSMSNEKSLCAYFEQILSPSNVSKRSLIVNENQFCNVSSLDLDPCTFAR